MKRIFFNQLFHSKEWKFDISISVIVCSIWNYLVRFDSDSGFRDYLTLLLLGLISCVSFSLPYFFYRYVIKRKTNSLGQSWIWVSFGGSLVFSFFTVAFFLIKNWINHKPFSDSDLILQNFAGLTALFLIITLIAIFILRILLFIFRLLSTRKISD
jgi:hypothetical protein